MATIILSILATYAVTTLIVDSDGPWAVFYRLRRIEWLSAFQCFLCLSVYVAAFFSLLSSSDVKGWVVHTFAYSGATILLYKLVKD